MRDTPFTGIPHFTQRGMDEWCVGEGESGDFLILFRVMVGREADGHHCGHWERTETQDFEESSRSAEKHVLFVLQEQTILITLSSTESEFLALADCSKTALWLRSLLGELKIEVTPTIYCDNLGALKLIENPVFHRRTKHIDVRTLFTRQLHERKQVTYRHVRTTENGADQLTKPLTKVQFEYIRALIGYKPWPFRQPSTS